jgi:hypothetical protein
MYKIPICFARFINQLPIFTLCIDRVDLFVGSLCDGILFDGIL